MTTIVNSPAPTQNDGGSGFLIGIIILIAFISLLLYFGIPAIKNMGAGQLNIPAPQIVVPDKIDVNVNPAK